MKSFSRKQYLDIDFSFRHLVCSSFLSNSIYLYINSTISNNLAILNNDDPSHERRF